MKERLVRIGAYVLAACVITLVLWIMTDQQTRIGDLGAQLQLANAALGLKSERIAVDDDFYKQMRQDMAELKQRLK